MAPAGGAGEEAGAAEEAADFEAEAAVAGAAEYLYDAAGRLAAVVSEESGEVAEYSYDAVGNITQVERRPSSELSVVSVVPRSAAAGDTVQVYGTGFPAAGLEVSVGGVAVQVSQVTATSASFVVPDTAAGGLVEVSAGAESVQGPELAVSGGEVTLAQVSPESGMPGSEVVLSGSGFAADPVGNVVTFNGQVAEIIEATSTSLRVVVPTHAGSGPLRVRTAHGTAGWGQDFVVPLDGVDPASIESVRRAEVGGASVDVPVTTAGNVAIVLFDAPIERRVDIGLTGSTFSGDTTYKVIAPDGEILGEEVTNGQSRIQATDLVLERTYALLITPASGSTGQVTVTVSTPLQDTATVTGASTVLTFDRPGQTARVDLPLEQGQNLTLALSVESLGWRWVKLLDPDGLTLADDYSSGSSAMMHVGEVPSSGTYTVLIQPDGPTTGSVNLTASWRADAGMVSLTSGATTFTAERAGQESAGTIDLTEGDLLTLALTNSTLGWRWLELFAPDGTRVDYDYASGASAVMNVGAVPATGTYTVVVRPDGPRTGSADVTASLRADAGPVSLTGGATTFTAERAGQESAGTIDLTEGDVLTLALTNSTLGWRWLELFAPDGTRVDYDYASGSAVMNVGAVPTTGTYTVVVRPNGPTTGSANVTASVRADAGELVMDGGPTSFVVQRAGQEVAASLDLVAGQDVALAWTVTSLGYRYVELFDPQGDRIASKYSFSSSDTLNVTAVPVTGTYTVVVRPTTASTGSVEMTASSPAEPVAPRAAMRAERTAGADDLAGERETSAAALGNQNQWPGQVLPQWRPDKDNLDGTDWLTRRPQVDAPKDRKAPAGATAVAGHVLGLDGTALAGVTVSAGDTRTTTDRKGRFLLRDVGSATSMIVVDGSSANTPDAAYGTFRIHVDVTEGKTTTLPATVWMPRLDTEHAVELNVPTASETVLTTPFIPGLEVRLPAGTVVRDAEGELVDELGITPIPIDRPPFPLPEDGIVPTYFTVQPGGTFVFPEGAQIVYPNYTGLAPGRRVEFWNYDPEERGWYVYGHGTVSDDATQVVPDEDTRVWSFDGAMFNVPSSEKPGQSRFSDFIDWLSGDPVDLSTGMLTDSRIDLAVDDGIAPISVERSYWQGDQASREFGVGQQLGYGMLLYSENEYQEVDLYLPGGAKVHYDRTSSGTGFRDAAFQAVGTSGPFRDSTITWIDVGWSLKTRDGLTYWFPDWSRATKITDRNGNTVSMTRDGAEGGGPGQDLTQITSPSGRWIKLAYDDAHRITEARDNIGRTVSYTYDTEGRLSTVTNPAGDVTQYAYDTADRITSITDARGIVYLSNEYDANGRVARQTLTDGQVYEFDYLLTTSGTVRETHVTRPDGTQRQVTFNTDGVATSDTIVAADGSTERTTTFTRRSDNLITQAIDPYGRVTTFDYDDQGRLESTTVLSGTADEANLGTTVYGRYDQPVQHTDPAGNLTQLRYDERGNLIESIDAEGRSRTATYNPRGQVATVTDAAGNTSELSWAAGDLVAITNPAGETTRMFTDAAGRRTSTTLPSGASRTVEYDVLNQPVRATDPLGNTQEYTYDANGNLTTFTDAAGHATSWTYDNSDRVVERTDALSASSTATYDMAGRVLTATSRAGRTTSYTYDSFGRVHTVQDAHAGTQSQVTYAYDNLDRLAQVTDSIAGATSYTYDTRDRVTEITEPLGISTYEYDDNSEVVSAVVTGQDARQFAYDGTGMLTAITQGSTAVELDQDSAGRLSQVTLPGGWTQSYTYDTSNLVTGLSYAHNGQPAGDLTYSHQPDGYVAAVGGSFANITLPAARDGLVYDAQNRLTSAGGTSITYDADGNMLDDGTRTFDWDARGRLSAVTQGATVTGFGYSPTGARSSRTTNGAQTGFLDLGPNTAVELDDNGTPSADLLSGGMDQWFARTHAGGTDAVLTDLLGSPIAFGAADGTLAAHYEYDPFGATATTGDNHGSDLGFTGRQNDGTGLTYHRARYYHPELGRFISEDPIGFAGGTNLYAYGANAPTTYTDPTGNNPLLIGCLAGGAIEGGIDYTVQRLSGRKVQWGQVGAAAATGCVTGMLGGFLTSRIIHAGRIGATANSSGARFITSSDGAVTDLVGSRNAISIGHYPAYVGNAQATGARTFSMSDEAWNAMSPAEQWARNQRFLDDAISRDSVIQLATPLSQVRAGSFLEREIMYLTSKGYKPNSAGNLMIPGGG